LKTTPPLWLLLLMTTPQLAATSRWKSQAVCGDNTVVKVGTVLSILHPRLVFCK
jgi:hypothetical protein